MIELHEAQVACKGCCLSTPFIETVNDQSFYV